MSRISKPIPVKKVKVEVIPTLDKPPKYERKKVEVPAPRDGAYGNGDEAKIAEFLKKKDMV